MASKKKGKTKAGGTPTPKSMAEVAAAAAHNPTPKPLKQSDIRNHTTEQPQRAKGRFIVDFSGEPPGHHQDADCTNADNYAAVQKVLERFPNNKVEVMSVTYARSSCNIIIACKPNTTEQMFIPVIPLIREALQLESGAKGPPIYPNEKWSKLVISGNAPSCFDVTTMTETGEAIWAEITRNAGFENLRYTLPPQRIGTHREIRFAIRDDNGCTTEKFLKNGLFIREETCRVRLWRDRAMLTSCNNCHIAPEHLRERYKWRWRYII